jgi:hypothetical protein
MFLLDIGCLQTFLAVASLRTKEERKEQKIILPFPSFQGCLMELEVFVSHVIVALLAFVKNRISYS